MRKHCSYSSSKKQIRALLILAFSITSSQLVSAHPVAESLDANLSSEGLSVVQQKKTLTGQVVDVNGSPMVGVTVMEKGTSNGGITDIDGKYSLEVREDAVIQFSYIGYKTIEMSASGKAKLNVTLKEDTEVLDEVVVTALGIKRAEKALTYNV